jgi:cytochrome c oxidase cbb3-type subunit 1
VRPVFSPRLSRFNFATWQVVVIATIIGILAGRAQAIAWGEAPAFLDPLAVIVLLLVGVNILMPILKSTALDHPALWYVIMALAWMAPVYAAGKFGPLSIAPFFDSMVALVFTPFALVVLYYFVPLLLDRPVWNRKLSLGCFWVFAISSPFASIRHDLFSPGAEVVSVVASLAVDLAILSIIVNFCALRWEDRQHATSTLPLRWFYAGVGLFLLATLQGLLQLLPPVQHLVEFTDWTVARSHLILFGVFGFWIFGIMTHVLPGLLGADGWHRPAWNAWHFRLTATGLIVMFFDLLGAGVVQGFLWQDPQPWDDSLRASRPFWLVRTMSGIALMAGQMMFLFNILMTAIPNRAEVAPGGSTDE